MLISRSSNIFADAVADAFAQWHAYETELFEWFVEEILGYGEEWYEREDAAWLDYAEISVDPVDWHGISIEIKHVMPFELTHEQIRKVEAAGFNTVCAHFEDGTKKRWDTDHTKQTATCCYPKENE